MDDIKFTREQVARIATIAGEQEADEIIVTDSHYAGNVDVLFTSDAGKCRARFEIQPDGAGH